MSLLKTTVAVDVQRVIDALPPKSYVHSVTLSVDRQGVEIVWDHDAIKTGRTYPVEYPLDKIMPSSDLMAPTNAGQRLDKRAKSAKRQ